MLALELDSFTKRFGDKRATATGLLKATTGYSFGMKNKVERLG